MAQLIVPSVQLELSDQYNQHYDSSINIPFQTNPANELKPLGQMAEAFAQYEDKIAESESNIEAQQALNDFNEYKSKQLTDLEQMPLAKAVEAYGGLNHNLENYAKTRGEQISNPKAKMKFDMSAGASLSDGRARGYALHAGQVTKQEVAVDKASIDTAAQDAVGSMGTPAFAQTMVNFRGTVDAIADKNGLTPEQKLSNWREQSSQVYLTGGTALIQEKRFSDCERMIQDNKNDMDQYTRVQLESKLNLARVQEAEHQAEKARVKANQEKSEISTNFNAALAAGDQDAADVCANQMRSYNSTLGQLMHERVALVRAGNIRDVIKDGITLGRDSQNDINALANVLPEVAPGMRQSFIDDIFVAGDKQTALTQEAEQKVFKARVEREEQLYNLARKEDQLEKAASHAAKVLTLDAEKGELLFDGIEKDKIDEEKKRIQAQLSDDKEELGKLLEAEDWEGGAEVLQRMVKTKPNLAKAWYKVLTKKQKDGIDTVNTKKATALEKQFNAFMEAGDLVSASEVYKKYVPYNQEYAKAMAAKLKAKSISVQNAQNEKTYKDLHNLATEYAKGGKWKLYGETLAKMHSVNPAMAEAMGYSGNKQQQEEFKKVQKQQAEEYQARLADEIKAKNWNKAADYAVLLGGVNPEAAKTKADVITTLSTADAAELKKQIIARHEKLYESFAAGNNAREALAQVDAITALDPVVGAAMKAKASKKFGDYAVSLFKQGVETNNEDLVKQGSELYASVAPNLSTEEQTSQLEVQRTAIGEQLLSKAKEMSTKNIASSSSLCQQIINSPNTNEADKQAAKEMLSQFAVDKTFTQLQELVKTKKYKDVGAALFTVNADGEREYSELAKQLNAVDDKKLSEILVDYENGNVEAEEQRIANIKKNKGLSDDEMKEVHDRYLENMLGGENGAVASYFIQHGIQNPTEYQTKTIREKLKHEFDSAAWEFADKTSKQVWESNTAEGAKFMQAYRTAQSIYNITIASSKEARDRALTSTNAMSQIPQEEQNKLLKIFAGDAAKEKEFVEFFNNMNTNHANGNPQTLQRVLLDIKADKYSDTDPYTAMKKVVTEYSDLSVAQLNEIDTALKERSITLRGGMVDKRSNAVQNFVSYHYEKQPYNKLEKGSKEQRAVMECTAKINDELNRRLGYNASIDAYQKEFSILITDPTFMKSLNISYKQAETQEDLGEGLKNRIEDASFTLSEAEAAGVDGSYSLEQNAYRRTFNYPHTFAGIQEYKAEARALGSGKVADRKAKEFVQKYFTEEEKAQYNIDKNVFLEKMRREYED